MTSPVTLTRLLARIDDNLANPEQARRLKRSPHERARVSANLEHARSLLLTLERQAATVRVQSQRQQQQAELQQKREAIKALASRLRDLNDAGDNLDDGEEDDDDEADDDEEDLLGTYAPARQDTDAGLEAGSLQGVPTSTAQQQQQQQQQLRSRRPGLQASDNHSQAATSAREQLFSGRPQRTDPSDDPNLSDVQRTETMMSHNRTEQESLTDGLLSLARALKESSMAFGAALETEKEVLKRAEGGLDKSALGMEAAERRMGMLRKMSEGQGWYGRLKLYGFIGGLWLVCFLLVFVGPKLRF